jgi:hypothetical protein
VQFAIMTWVNTGASVGSINGVLDKDNLGQLPSLSKNGHWADVGTVDETLAPWSNEAKAAIAEHGYFLVSGTSKP